MTTAPSATTWGLPTATKHALLIHGLSSSSYTWHRVATSLAAQGYLVTAPNLIGHAGRLSDDYHYDTITQDVLPYLKARTYSLIIGHSLGAITVLHLLPYLDRSNPKAIILVDPPLNITPDVLALWEDIFATESAANKTVETYVAENPLWTREDAIHRILAVQMCPLSIIHAILVRNRPWYYLDRIKDVPEKWKMSVVLADPAISITCPVDELAPYPRVSHVFARGTGHWIQSESPDVIVDEALKRMAELNNA